MILTQFTFKKTFLIVVLLTSIQLLHAQDPLYIYESQNDSTDLSNNFYDYSDELLFVFEDTLLFASWDTERVHSRGINWAELGDSIVLPLLISENHRYVHPINNPVTSRFGPRRGRYHYGTDVNLNDGDPVLASFDGMVRYAGFSGGYGNVIVIRHFNGLETVYAHLSKINVETGRIVAAGDEIGLGGRTGRSRGAHLHFETRFRGIAINPEDLIDFQNFKLKSDTLVLYQKNFSLVNSANPRISTGTPSATRSTSTVSPDAKYHTVKKGETLGHIAARHRTSIDALCRLNGIKRTSIIREGQKLRVR